MADVKLFFTLSKSHDGDDSNATVPLLLLLLHSLLSLLVLLLRHAIRSTMARRIRKLAGGNISFGRGRSVP